MNENINVKKKSNALKYVLTFVGGAAIGAGALFGYNTFMDSKAPVTDNTSNTEVETSTDTEKTDNTEVSIPQTTINMPTTLEYGDYYLNLFFEGGRLGGNFSSFINSKDLNSATIAFNTNDIKYYLTTNGVNLTVAGDLSGKVTLPNPIVNIISNGRSEFGGSDYAVYFLLNDGTVYSLNTLNALKATNFTSGIATFPAPILIEGLSDVTSIQNVTLGPKAGGQGIAGIGTIAIKSDGTIVPLSAK